MSVSNFKYKKHWELDENRNWKIVHVHKDDEDDDDDYYEEYISGKKRLTRTRRTRRTRHTRHTKRTKHSTRRKLN